MTLLKFGPGWMKLLKFEFEFEFNGTYWLSGACDPLYNARYPYRYDISCENMKDLRLAKIVTDQEIGLRFLLRKCKALEKLCLDYVVGLDKDESEVIALFQNCSNLRSTSLRFMPRCCGVDFRCRTALTDDSLKALSLYCCMLEVVEFTFTFCAPEYPSEIGFMQEGIIMQIHSCPIHAFMLNGANNLGMRALSSAQLLERLKLVDCGRVTDAGIRFIMRAPCLTTLTLRKCKNVTDGGIAELVRSQKLESLTAIGWRQISGGCQISSILCRG